MKGVKGSKAELFIVGAIVFLYYRSLQTRADYYYQQSEMLDRQRLEILKDIGKSA